MEHNPPTPLIPHAPYVASTQMTTAEHTAARSTWQAAVAVVRRTYTNTKLSQ